MELLSKLWIGGQWRPSLEGNTYPVIDPSTGRELGRAPQAGGRDVELAISAAQQGFSEWRQVDPWRRAAMLRKISAAIGERRDDIAMCMAHEIGKPVEQGRAEVQVAIEQFDWYADETRRVYGDIVTARSPRLRHYVAYQPVGVVAAFSPWNFPIALAARKLAPALAAGCAVIARPAEESPGAVAAMFECIEAAGLPAGTVNLLNGFPEGITPHLLASPIVRKVSFTGSVTVGKMIARASADTLKKVTMELGGHAPVVVFGDVDVPAVVKQCLGAKFRNAGQICVSPTRFFVHESIKSAFLEEFVRGANALRVGPGTEVGTEMGPLATTRRLVQLQELIEDAVTKGATLCTGGSRAKGFSSGNYFAPTVLADVPENARIMFEEPFGPVAIINGFDDSNDAYKRANATPLGLAAYAFTQSLAAAFEASERLEAGVVSINTFAASTTEIPFGGIKDSGYGRECGALGIREYLESKTINMLF